MAAKRYGDEDIVRQLYGLGTKRKRGASTQPQIKDLLLDHLAKGKYSKDFTIFGGGLQWRLSSDHASLSNLIEAQSLAASPPVKSFHPDSKYPPFLIDVAVQCMYWGTYSAKYDYKFKCVQDADDVNNFYSLHPIPDMAAFHVNVYMFGKYLEYENLSTVALGKLRTLLVAKKPAFGIDEFKSLVRHVWGTTRSDSFKANLETFKGPDADVRRLLASFGATWDLAWHRNSEDDWEMLTSFTGVYTGYAIWHAEARKWVNTIGNGKLAPRVKEAMSEKKKSDKVAKEAVPEKKKSDTVVKEVVPEKKKSVKVVGEAVPEKKKKSDKAVKEAVPKKKKKSGKVLKEAESNEAEEDNTSGDDDSE